MKVSEVAAAAGVSPRTARFYARSGLLAPERNPLNGHAQCSEVDAQRLRFICKAQRVGFTLAEVRTLLAMARRESPCPLVRSIVGQRLPQVPPPHTPGRHSDLPHAAPASRTSATRDTAAPSGSDSGGASGSVDSSSTAPGARQQQQQQQRSP